jgi:hypothetical protein
MQFSAMGPLVLEVSPGLKGRSLVANCLIFYSAESLLTRAVDVHQDWIPLRPILHKAITVQSLT